MTKRIPKKQMDKIFEDIFGKEQAKVFTGAKTSAEDRYEAKNG